jgi:hypothetical protein
MQAPEVAQVTKQSGATLTIFNPNSNRAPTPEIKVLDIRNPKASDWQISQKTSSGLATNVVEFPDKLTLTENDKAFAIDIPKANLADVDVFARQKNLLFVLETGGNKNQGGKNSPVKIIIEWMVEFVEFDKKQMLALSNKATIYPHIFAIKSITIGDRKLPPDTK